MLDLTRYCFKEKPAGVKPPGCLLDAASDQMHRVAIEARRHDLFLTFREISEPLETTVSPLRVDVFAVRICGVPVKPFVAATDNLHGGRRHTGVVAAAAYPMRLIFGADAAADFAIVA